METSLEELNKKFGLEGILSFEAGIDGLPSAVVKNDHASARIYPHGALISDYQPHGHHPILFISKEARLKDGAYVHGGIPICWPWFGGHSTDPSNKPFHGFVRQFHWELLSTSQIKGQGTCLEFSLESGPHTKDFWPHAFGLVYSLVIGSSLKAELTVYNRDTHPFTCSQALHTYFHVADVRQVRLNGLGGTPYLDNTRDLVRDVQQEDRLRINKEVDRIYLDTLSTCEIEDPILGRSIEIRKQGSASTVVWNPWQENAGEMANFGREEWTKMLCVETANVRDSSVVVPAGGNFTMKLRVSSRLNS